MGLLATLRAYSDTTIYSAAQRWQHEQCCSSSLSSFRLLSCNACFSALCISSTASVRTTLVHEFNLVNHVRHAIVRCTVPFSRGHMMLMGTRICLEWWQDQHRDVHVTSRRYACWLSRFLIEGELGLSVDLISVQLAQVVIRITIVTSNPAGVHASCNNIRVISIDG